LNPKPYTLRYTLNYGAQLLKAKFLNPKLSTLHPKPYLNLNT